MMSRIGIKAMHQDSFIYKNFEREQLPHFGFKIHISATFKNYMTIRELILPFLNKKKVAYKFLKDEQEVLFIFFTKRLSQKLESILPFIPVQEIYV